MTLWFSFGIKDPTLKFSPWLAQTNGSLTLNQPDGTKCLMAWSGSESPRSEPTKVKTEVIPHCNPTLNFIKVFFIEKV